jgi:DNA replication licensing factor MCM4
MVGIKNLDEVTLLRRLAPKDINKLIGFRGIVIRCSEYYPEMKLAAFKCNNCSTTVTVSLENAKVQEPTECYNCRQRNTLEIVHNLCRFTDKQYIKFQELPETVPEG